MSVKRLGLELWMILTGDKPRMVFDFDDLNREKSYAGWRRYCESKLANILWNRELARRIEGSGVTANCLHPGVVKSNLAGDNPGLFAAIWRSVGQWFMISEARGAETSIYLCASDEVAGISGEYFVDCKQKNPRPWAMDDEAGERLWRVTEECTGYIFFH